MEDEDLGRKSLRGRVDPADECLDLPARQACDGLTELGCVRVLEEQSRLAQPLVFANSDQVALGGGERVLERADKRVVSRPLAPRARRATAKLFLVEVNHLVRDVREHAAGTLVPPVL